jgi:hypothetical protein
MVEGEEMDTHRRIIPHNRNIMESPEEVECHHRTEGEGVQLRDHQQPMGSEEDTINEVVDKVEDIHKADKGGNNKWVEEVDRLH